ncbi:MAG: PDDEXK nuclease domain-containing protein [Paludibacteraceae bacterium]|nr:PDDEXK nuclease domain-containing protein [Paludibacteraceae bacterium]
MDSISIINPEYKQWVKDLSLRYRQAQIRAAVKVNEELIRFYYNLGRDIVNLKVEERWGENVMARLCVDLKNELPGVSGLSKSNIYYCKKFYLLYNQEDKFFQQAAGKLEDDAKDEIFQQLDGIFQIPWGHHCLIMDKLKGDLQKSLFYVHKTIENGWSRAMLLNFLDTNFYERESKAISNFTEMLPEPMSDLAQEITRDPYNFTFAGIRGKYNETQLKAALLHNITHFLLELGAGFCYVGREFELKIGTKEKYADLLFYHLNLRCYVVVEVKVEEFDSPDISQLGTYMVAVNHQFKRPEDNPTLGILICKSKDKTLAQYSLEASSQPIAISSYDLEKLYPTKVEGYIPSEEELESQADDIALKNHQ